MTQPSLNKFRWTIADLEGFPQRQVTIIDGELFVTRAHTLDCGMLLV